MQTKVMNLAKCMFTQVQMLYICIKFPQDFKIKITEIDR